MAKIKVRCKGNAFRERSLNFIRVRPANVIVVSPERAKILVDGGWVDYLNDSYKQKTEKALEPDRETKELKEVKNEETK